MLISPNSAFTAAISDGGTVLNVARYAVTLPETAQQVRIAESDQRHRLPGRDQALERVRQFARPAPTVPR